MHFLILGGTGFLGARTVEFALERGHSVTLFTRGKTSATRFADEPRVTHLVGDRDPEVGAGLEALTRLAESGAHFDAVLDVSGYLPRHVAASTKCLAPLTPTYLFISSVSVYDAPVPNGVDERGALIRLADPSVEEITPETYGGLKVLCEELVREHAGSATLIVRPGILAGPDDFTDRFSYWVWAADAARGRELLCPGDPSDPTQVLDAADLGLWLVELCERGTQAVRNTEGTDTFNASASVGATTIGAVIAAALAGTRSDAEPVWVPAEFLAAHEVQPFADMPLWLPPELGRSGILTADSSRALGAGLRCRPLAETARATWEWLQQDLAGREVTRPITGLDLERAGEVLALWRAQA